MKLTAIVGSLAVTASVALFALPAPAAPKTNESESTTFKVDGVHSSIIFGIRHMGVSNVYGRFNNPTGEFTFDPAHPEDAKFNVSVKTADVDTGNEARDKHLRSVTFFNVDSFATINFTSTSVKPGKDGKFELAGNVSLLGKTKPITASLEWIGTHDGGEQMGFRGGFETRFTVKRSDFGMDYGITQGAVGDDVSLIVAIEGVRQ